MFGCPKKSKIKFLEEIFLRSIIQLDIIYELIGPLYERAQIGLNAVEKFYNSNGLSIKPEKTSLVLFTRKRKLESNRKPTLFDVTLENSAPKTF